MYYKIKEAFGILIKRSYEELEETEFKATKITNLKPTHFVEVKKKRSFLELEGFYYEEILLTDNLLDLIAFVSCLNTFSSNKIDTSTDYEFDYFSVSVKTKDKKTFLSIKFNELEEVFYFDKLECNVMYSKINKIISKLEV